MKKFNKKFIFSTSTCAFQIEGGRQLGGRKYSNWDKFTIDNYYIPKVGTAEREIASIEVASDFYNRRKEDVEIMKNIGVNGFVYNMDWARIFPNNGNEVNEEGLKWYEDLFKDLVNKGIEPIPILYHWDSPLWLEEAGGTSGDIFLGAWRKFCEVVFTRLGKYSKHWFVNDENSSYTISGYMSDYMPPQKNSPKQFWIALHNLNMSGAIGKKTFEEAKIKGYIDKDALLGIDHDWSPAVPYDQNDFDDLKACQIFNKYNLDLYLDPNMLGEYPKIFFEEIKKLGINPIKIGDLELLKKYTLDFIGWNYYRPTIVASSKRRNENIDWHLEPGGHFSKDVLIVFPKTEKYTSWNWLIKPETLLPGAKYLYKKYKVPLMIVENGIGYFDIRKNDVVSDHYRVDYLNSHLQVVQQAIDEGVQFIGYSLWTYCDIFSPSGGYRKKYGLVGVDFENKTLNRYPKASYVWYKNIIKNKTTYNINSIPYDEFDQETIQEYKKDIFKK